MGVTRVHVMLWSLGTLVIAGGVGVTVYFTAPRQQHLTGDCPSLTGDCSSLTELRGLWIATVANIDWPSSSSISASEQRQELIHYFDVMQSLNMNMAILQVRPAGDAMYQSDLEPWSEWLTGKQGLAPDPLWDPLEVAVTEAHSRGIELHAWINPYRASRGGKNKTQLSDTNMANRFSQYAYTYGDYIWMDPGSTDVQDWIIDVVLDMINRYDIDGIHMDDYFYPYTSYGHGLWFPDNATYSQYQHDGGSLGYADWRRENCNTLIRRLYTEVKAKKSSVKVTIAPGGMYRPGTPEGIPLPVTGGDSYSTIYVDSLKWLREGWLDVLIPQIYWSICPEEHSYLLVLDWWLSQNIKNKQICAGTAAYKIRDDYESWDPKEITRQVKISRSSDYRQQGSLGNVHYSAKYFRDNLHNISDLFRNTIYKEKATMPKLA